MPYLGACELPLAFVSGNGMWIFLAFLVLFFFAICHGYYTRTGSAINQRPYDGTAATLPAPRSPALIGRDVARRDYSRGTR